MYLYESISLHQKFYTFVVNLVVLKKKFIVYNILVYTQVM